MDMLRVYPIVVQFGVGALLCAVGLWAGVSSGYVDLKLPRDRRAIVIIVFGFVALLALAGAFTFWLPFVPEEVTP